MHNLIQNIKKCNLCYDLPHGIRPVVQLNEASKVLIIGQAPGKKVHETGIPWNDKSGETLRKWLNVSSDTFYNPKFISVMAMGFCYPGKGVSGDLPPRPECAKLWHPQILGSFNNKPLVLLIGQYAQRFYLNKSARASLTENVKNFRSYMPDYFVLPHPSPRNQNWVKVNPWFMDEVIPELQKQVRDRLQL